ncbi:MAG: glutamate/tyrosine decarboxylase-like PLP-dependent enzyme [Chlamydiales bacterium]|jgi:glutamate/tyrosine decarboxylase-like PLP-dependent enzyme
MTPRLPDREEFRQTLELVLERAQDYLSEVDSLPVRRSGADAAAAHFDGPLPETGDGASETLRELLDHGTRAVITSSGPRFFHFVIGGVTPAALAADWMASIFDQVASAWVTSPLAVQLELTSIEWLKQLFGLDPGCSGIMTSGAMMANFTGLTAARQWWGMQHDVDIATEGFEGLPRIPVFSSGYLHISSIKALSMLGIGRAQAQLLSRDEVGRLDLEALEEALRKLDGAPAILIANAGEVNAGDFDPVQEMADLAKRYGAWLHVDGAFGLFAAVSPRTAHLVQGIERADSVTVDGHKWLNVPYDCGFSFVRDKSLLARSMTMKADYLPDPEGEHAPLSNRAPESSRRARSLTVWATLHAYGRAGVRTQVERHLDQAQRLARAIDDSKTFQRLAEVPLNIVCFRCDPGGLDEQTLDALNTRLGEALLEDGRVFAGLTRYGGRVALRPAIVNWRTRDGDIDLLMQVLEELAVDLIRESQPSANEAR